VHNIFSNYITNNVTTKNNKITEILSKMNKCIGEKINLDEETGIVELKYALENMISRLLE